MNPKRRIVSSFDSAPTAIPINIKRINKDVKTNIVIRFFENLFIKETPIALTSNKLTKTVATVNGGLIIKVLT